MILYFIFKKRSFGILMPSGGQFKIFLQNVTDQCFYALRIHQIESSLNPYALLQKPILYSYFPFFSSNISKECFKNICSKFKLIWNILF